MYRKNTVKTQVPHFAPLPGYDQSKRAIKSIVPHLAPLPRKHQRKYRDNYITPLGDFTNIRPK